ncbi:MAG: YicC family protein [Phycisphaeraceae bacterium]|nr:YicC family protein [Phycisphaeraceae bacterium]
MTGFGQAADQVDGVHYAVEIRSVNNRYFKSTIRLPDELASLEANLESQLRARVHRGSITMTVKFRLADNVSPYQINDTALEDYLKHLQKLRDQVGNSQTANIDLTALLGLPGVLVQTDDIEQVATQARAAVKPLVDQACDGLLKMRQTEGKTLALDLLIHREVITTRLAEVAKRAPLVVDEYHLRLRNRIADLLAKAQLEIAQPELIREIAIYAERCDISEEVSRLTGHMQQFEEILTNALGDPSGRTLDFLTQEMLREANTIASKSNDVTIARHIVEIKGSIDRIKEQVQNVE